MESFKTDVLPQNIRCLANHKLKARIHKNNMMRDRIYHKEDVLGAKIIKYQTFLSQNMLQNIRTQDLAEFQSQVRQFCSNKKNMPSHKSQTVQRSLNIHSLFDEVRKQLKIKQKAKRHSKTYQNSQSNFMLLAKPTQLINRENLSCETQKNSQLIREQFGENNQLRRKPKQISLKGKFMNNILVGIMQKMEEMKYFSNKSGRKLGGALMELQTPNQLKAQKQRLNTASDGNQRIKFVPLGKKSQENAKIYHSQEKLFISQMPKIKNKNVSESKQMKKIVIGQKKISQLRKSTLKLESQLGLKFKNKRNSAHFCKVDILDSCEQDQINEINYF